MLFYFSETRSKRSPIGFLTARGSLQQVKALIFANAIVVGGILYDGILSPFFGQRRNAESVHKIKKDDDNADKLRKNIIIDIDPLLVLTPGSNPIIMRNYRGNII